MVLTGARRQALGRWGEQQAAAHLESLGWQVVGRNWRCAAGEIDLVARQPDGTTVLVEVKTRSGRGYGDPLESVTVAKQAKLRELAMLYRRAHSVGRLRVDAVGVLRGPDGVSVRHVEGVLS